MYFKHVETFEDYRNQLSFEADKSKNINDMTFDELRRLNQRLLLERDTQGLIIDLRRNAGNHDPYDTSPKIDIHTPVEQLYHNSNLIHHGVRGMRWGVTTKSSSGRSKKNEKPKPKPKSEDFKKSRLLKQKPLSEMSNEEIRRVGERLRLEKEYSRITRKEKSSGRRFAENFAYAAAPFAITTASSIGLKKLTPYLNSKGFDSKQITQIADSLPKIGAAISIAVKAAQESNSSSRGRVDDDE